jgi:hypothetical protein
MEREADLIGNFFERFLDRVRLVTAIEVTVAVLRAGGTTAQRGQHGNTRELFGGLLCVAVCRACCDKILFSLMCLHGVLRPRFASAD